MHVVQISDPDVLFGRAASRTVEVTAVAGSVPVTVSPSEVVLAPVLNVYYCLEFEDEEDGPTRWTHVEALRAGPDGVVLMSGTLLARLRASGVSVLVRRRSGSVDV